MTLPFLASGTGINSWFDHNWPGLTSQTYLPFDRYDGFRDSSTAALLTNCTSGYNCYNGHTGVDYALTTGTVVVAAAPGKIVQASSDSCLGTFVRIWHASLGYSTLYAHLDSYTVSQNDMVLRRQQIGTSGNTGACTTGPHLHFEARNAQSGGSYIDPYGWSGSGVDPDEPGRAYGHLMAIRMGRLTGGSLYIKDGGLNEQWLYEYSSVTSFQLAGNRIGILSGGVPYVKDGPWDAQWVQEYSSASRLALSGRRIGIVSNGTGLVKEGGLSEQWTTYGCCFSEIEVVHGERNLPNRVGLLAGTYFFVSEGALGTTPTLVATNAKSIAMGAGWIGYIDTNNKAWAKGGVNDNWTWMQDNVQSLVLGGAGDDRRIGVIQNSIAKVKEDSLYGTWVTQWTGASKLDVNSGRIAVLTTGGEARVKEGGPYDQWTIVYASASQLLLN